jgi:hypothetical protein
MRVLNLGRAGYLVSNFYGQPSSYLKRGQGLKTQTTSPYKEC